MRIPRTTCRRIVVLTVVGILMAQSIPVVAGTLTIPGQKVKSASLDPAFTLHPPIHISGDEGPSGFILGHHPITKEPLYRPGSGVVHGSGTQDDPYVISGWHTPSIGLHGTLAHVRIEDNGVHPFGPVGNTTPGILLAGSQNVHVHANIIDQATPCIDVRSSHDVRISANDLDSCSEQGILVQDSSEVLVEKNTVQTAAKAIELYQSKNVQVLDNHLGHSHTAFYGVSAENVLVEGNLIGSFARGIQFTTSHNVTIASHVIESLEVGGIILWLTDNATTSGNVLRGMPTGINIWAGAHHVHKDNLIEENQEGVVITNDYVMSQTYSPFDDLEAWLQQLLKGPQWQSGSGQGRHEFLDNEIRRNTQSGIKVLTDLPALVLEGNNIHENSVGLEHQGQNDEVDAQANWWGCPGGPTAPGCDSVTGPAKTLPWLTHPNPSAGN